MIPGRFNTSATTLDRRINLQYALRERSAAGGVVDTWVNAATVWAAKQPQGGNRFYAAEQKHFENTLVYRIRHRSDVAAGWRVLHGDDIFEVVNTVEIGRAHFVELTLRGIDQTPGSALDVLQLEGSGAEAFLQIEDGTPLVLEAVA